MALSYDQLTNKYKQAWTKLKKFENQNNNQNNFGEEGPYTTFDDDFTELEAEQIVIPLIQPTNTYLQQNYDIDLSENFASLDDPRIALIGQGVLRLEQLELEGKTIDTSWFDEPLIQKSFSYQNNFDEDPSSYDCALRAIGIEAVVKFFSSGTSSVAKAAIKKKALRKMITKIATRTSGIVGAAIAIHQFGDCMEWW